MSVPAERHSVLLPLLGMSYDHTIVYHRWIGYMTIAVVTAHLGVQWWTWSVSAIDYVAQTFSSPAYTYGFVAWLCALVMFVTALAYVRRYHFNRFFAFHHLFIAFYVLSALHAPKYARRS